MKLVVTGASGFIGRELRKLNINNVSYISRSNTVDNNFFKIGDIDSDTDWSILRHIDADCLIHLAGLAHSNVFSELDILKVNYEGTINLAEHCAQYGVKRFIYISSIGVVGNRNSTTPINESMMEKPEGIVNHYKLLTENALRRIEENTGLEVVIIRPPMVYGSNAPANFDKFFKLVKFLRILPFGRVRNLQDFVYVENLVDFILLCSHNSNAAGKTFMVSDCHSISLLDFSKEIADSLGKKCINIPIPLVFFDIFFRLINRPNIASNFLRPQRVDMTYTKKHTGWIPPFNLKQAIKKTGSNYD
ncbi:NAD-dependent epimerase/dehydratase family protein [Vibrio gigantis]|uniref:NAD-dependent epimerase/dehydratase family protein n=1 Tax=Vibrio gigantis TaxID=296199 RepID=UPI0035A5728F